MKAMETLDFADNKITVLQGDVSKLSALTNLFVQGNAITGCCSVVAVLLQCCYRVLQFCCWVLRCCSMLQKTECFD